MTPPLSDIPSPWVWQVGDPGEQLTFTVNWDTATGEIMSAIVFRDIACVYDTLYISTNPYPVELGETLIRYRDFTVDYQSIYDIIMAPITVGQPQAYNTTIPPTLLVP